MSTPPPKPKHGRTSRVQRSAAPAPQVQDATQTVDRKWLIIGAVTAAFLLLAALILFLTVGLAVAVALGVSSGGSSNGSAKSIASQTGVVESQPSEPMEPASGEPDTTPPAPPPPPPPADDPQQPQQPPNDASPADQSGGSGSGNGVQQPAAPSQGGKVYTIPGGQFFGIETDGRSFVYVIDCSVSMQGAPIQRAKQEILRSISSLSSDQSFFIIFFSSTEYPMYYPDATSSLALATQDNVEKATDWVKNFSVRGGTDPEQAMLRALKLAPDAVYLLTDGDFKSQIVRSIALANTQKIKINTVSFINRDGDALLKQIASQSGGVHLFVP